jgi:putative membrane protein
MDMEFPMFDGLSLVWPWNPGVLLFLVILSLLYTLGLRNVRVRDVQAKPDHPVKLRHMVAFFSAIVIMAIVLLTPVDTIARTQLFLMHMAQAVILTTVCAPLILVSCPSVLLEPLLRLPVVGPIVRTVTRPLVASITFNVLFLLWHTPRLYHLALLYHAVLLSIFFAALMNWWPLLGSVRELRKMGYPLQMLYAFFDGQPVDIFAFVLVFTGVAIYPYYAIPPQLGISPFADQAVGGALLLIPGLVDLVVMSPLFFRWLNQIEQQNKLKDQQRLEEENYDEDEDEVEETGEMGSYQRRNGVSD